MQIKSQILPSAKLLRWERHRLPYGTFLFTSKTCVENCSLLRSANDFTPLFCRRLSRDYYFEKRLGRDGDGSSVQHVHYSLRRTERGDHCTGQDAEAVPRIVFSPRCTSVLFYIFKEQSSAVSWELLQATHHLDVLKVQPIVNIADREAFSVWIATIVLVKKLLIAMPLFSFENLGQCNF